MKKIFTGLFLLLTSLTVHAQTAQEIIAKYETAAGGREKLEAIKNLEVISTVKMAVMGQEIELPLTLVRDKGKLFRRQIGGVFGMGDSYTMLTDTAGYVFIPAMRGFGDTRGTEATITPVKKEEVAAQQYELDCSGAFAELVDYASKGHTAQLIGTEKVSKVPCYKIKITLKTGQQVTYYFDTQTFLVKQVEATGEMAMNLTGFGSMMKAFGRNPGKDTKASLLIKEYQEFSGIKYPVKLTLSFGPVESEVENTTVKINEGIEEKWYKIK